MLAVPERGEVEEAPLVAWVERERGLVRASCVAELPDLPAHHAQVERGLEELAWLQPRAVPRECAAERRLRPTQVPRQVQRDPGAERRRLHAHFLDVGLCIAASFFKTGHA